jgi:uncharacterized membrane protein YcaP (DUF421 family)
MQLTIFSSEKIGYPLIIDDTIRCVDISVIRGFFILDFYMFQNTFFEAIVMILIGMIALRLAGRKSIAEMTISQAVIMIAVGSILVEPVKDKNIVVTISSIFFFIIVLFILEMIALKIPMFEKIFFGKSVILIEEGKIKFQNLKRLRMTERQLNMLLRQHNIGEVTDVKIATLEANGQLGYEVYEDAKSMTVGEFKKLTGNFFDQYQKSDKAMGNENPNENLFDELDKNNSRL